jgi:hypothetical protein
MERPVSRQDAKYAKLAEQRKTTPDMNEQFSFRLQQRDIG